MFRCSDILIGMSMLLAWTCGRKGEVDIVGRCRWIHSVLSGQCFHERSAELVCRKSVNDPGKFNVIKKEI